jgi:serine/threonine protein kinase
MGAAAVHPTDQMLQSYGLGKLDDDSSDSVSHHLEGCAACQSRVAEMSSDSFLVRLRGAQGRPEESATGWAHSQVSRTDRGPTAVIAPSPADTMPPGLADHPDYEVIKELGRGGMGVVFLAHNRLLGRDEVLKVMARHIMERPGLLARFLAEMRAVARLQHPNIVTAYSAFRLGESILFAMEYVEGLDLAKLVKAKGPLPVAHASYFVSQAAQGMQHAHEQGMVHRDIKPGNLMLSHKGSRAVIKVLDFGLAKATREAPVDGGLTNPGQALGTPDYMAPEQIRDAQKADIRADIYSLGCTLYYLLSGGPPFRAENLWDLYQAHHSMDAKLLNFVRPDVPGELAALVAKMMAKEPERRFQTPSEVAQALAPFFKKANAIARALNQELSQVGQPERRPESPARVSVPTQPATSLAPAPAPPAKKPTTPAAPETRWESLIEFKETEPLREPAPAVKKKVVEKPRWLWQAAAAGILVMALLAGFAAWQLRVKTPNGTIVLENVPADASVEVDGKKITVTPTGTEPLKIEIQPGEHGVLVKRGKDVLLGESVTIESGKHFKLTVRLDPPVPEQPEKIETTKQPAEVVPPPAIDRSSYTEISGQWRVKGEELVQTDAARWYNELFFGNEQWTDYDFTVDAMRDGGGSSFSLFFRSTQPGNEFDYTIAGDGYKTCTLQARERPQSSTLKSHDFSLRDGTWYTARVHVRGNHIVCSIYDTYNATETRVFDVYDDRHPRGRVGLQTFGASFRFKNIRVIAPDGRVLWEGAPAVATTTPPEFSGPADRARASVKDQHGFVQLFNGIDRTGWMTHPQQPGNWHVENGNLVGSGPGSTSHLYTVRDDYKDFHLRAEARINDVGNSGVYFHAPFGPSWPANDPRFPISYEAQICAKPGGQIYTGSLYAGPDNVVTVNVRPVLPLEWFTLEVIARGNHVVVKVNDMITADYSDMKRLYSGGHVALQQNGAETIVEFRKIEINELSPDSAALIPKTQSAGPEDVNVNASRPVAGFVPLFNGKDTAGWTAWGKQGRLTQRDAAGIWWVRDGVLHGVGGPCDLFSPRADYKNFRVRAEAMINDGGNSGVFLRVTEGWNYLALAGYEAQINSTHRDPNKTGSLYRPGGPPIQVHPSPVPPDTWFKLEAEAVGDRIRIWIDDRLCVDWVDPQKTYTQGHIAIQAHHPGSHVQIRKLEVMELDDSGEPILDGGGRDGGTPRRKSSGRGKGKPSR